MPNRYKIAVDIQDACNLTAVVNTLARVCEQALREGKSTDAPRKDPAVIAIVDKINDMIGRPEVNTVMGAFDTCEKLAKEE